MNVIPWATADILEATGGERVCGERERPFSGIGTDSRTISPDQLFVAIQGENHDGHRFADAVVRQGIRGMIVARDRIADLPWQLWAEHNVLCVAVADTTRALGDLAAFNRQRAGISVVAITGSNGKTTTRTMTSAVVAQRFSTLSTQGNFNNEIGLPLTLFRLRPDHQWAVLELGMNHVGEIRRLARICKPDAGIITNIGPAHLKGLGSVENVMRAKGELLEEMGPGRTAVLNADDPWLVRLAGETPCRVLCFGLSPEAHVRAVSVEETADGSRFVLELPDGCIPVRLKVPGRFMVSNALAAAAVGHVLGLVPEEIRAGLETFEPVGGRMHLIRTRTRVHLIDDTYNANPASVKAAIETLRSLSGRNRGIIALGDMLELGSEAEALHCEVGVLAAESGAARLCVTGVFAGEVADGALGAGMTTRQIFTGSRREIIDDLKAFIRPDDWVLVKGSRGMAMEKVLNAIRAWADEKNELSHSS